MKYLTLLGLALWLGGCAETAHLKLPGNFVELESSQSERYGFTQRGLSADECLIGLRIEKNLKNGSLDFWSQSIQGELADRGYQFTGEEPLKNPAGLSGILQKYVRKDMSYWIAIYVKENQVCIGEAGGKTPDFEKHEKEIRDALASVQF